MKYFSLFLWLLLLVPQVPLRAQAHYIQARLEQVVGEQGLYQQAFYSMQRGPLGNLWFGSQNGLVQFDGYRFHTFINEPDNPNSVAGNFVRRIRFDAQGRLWIVGNDFLDIYYPDTQIFQHVPLPQISVLVGLFFLENMRLLVTDQGIARLEDDLSLTWILSSEEIGQVFSAGVQDGLFWMSSDRGIFSMTNDSFEPVLYEGLAHLAGASLYTVGHQKLLLKHSSKPMHVLNTHTGELRPAPGILNDAEVRIGTVFQDKDNYVWIGCSAGLLRLDLQTMDLVPFISDEYEDAMSWVMGMHQDDNMLMWIGCYGHGLFRYDPRVERLGHVEKNRFNSTQLTSNIVLNFVEDDDGGLYIAHANGITYMDLSTKKIWDKTEKIFSNGNQRQIFSIWLSSDDQLWGLREGSGLFRHDLDSGQTRIYDAYQKGKNTAVIYARRRANGKIWVATRTQGILIFDPQKETYSVKPRGKQPGQIPGLPVDFFEDSQKTMWVGTFGSGLFRYDEASEQFHNFNKEETDLSSDNVFCMAEDRNGRLWLGTTGGLNQMLEDGNFRTYSTREGLPNDTIYCIVFDQQGYLWASTNRGLFRLDIETDQVHILSLKDGLQDNEFNSHAGLLLGNGFLAFGGINGFNIFDPKTALTEREPPRVLLTDFVLGNKSAPVGDGQVLRRNIGYTRHIQLNYLQREFGFEFAAPSSQVPKQTRYTYILDGFDGEWQEVSAQRRFANYTNLPSGTYTMRVKAAYPFGDYGPEAVVKLTLAPPLWLSGWAFAAYISFALSLVYIYLSYQRRIKERLQRLVEKRTAQLEARNNELRAMDRVVANMNEVLHPEEVLQALTKEVQRHFPGADRVAYVLVNPATRIFRFVAISGVTGTAPPSDNVREIQRQFRRALNPVADGVYIAHNCEGTINTPLLGNRPPKSMIALDIRIEGHGEGYLTIANLSDGDAFRKTSVEALGRVRQHATSALSKARNIKDLVAAQKALIDSAHASGMAELAMEVMHNIGTQANNAKTSAQLVVESTHDLNLAPTLRRLAQVVETKTQPLDRKRIQVYLRGLADKQEQAYGSLKEEVERLDRYLQSITHDLYAQQDHTSCINSVATRVDLNEVVDEVLRSERYVMGQERIQVIRKYALKAPISAHPTQVRRIITYILGNCREAMYGADQKITVATGQVDNTCFLTISDNGRGIDAANLDHVFRPGFTTHADKRGFGLHYCANAIKEMDGTISIHSPGRGKGTVVRIEFIAYKEPTPTAMNAPS